MLVVDILFIYSFSLKMCCKPGRFYTKTRTISIQNMKWCVRVLNFTDRLLIFLKSFDHSVAYLKLPTGYLLHYIHTQSYLHVDPTPGLVVSIVCTPLTVDPIIY